MKTKDLLSSVAISVIFFFYVSLYLWTKDTACKLKATSFHSSKAEDFSQLDVSGFCGIVHATCDCFHLEAHFSLLVNMRNHFHLDNVEMFCTCYFKPKLTLLHDAFCCNVFTVSCP